MTKKLKRRRQPPVIKLTKRERAAYDKAWEAYWIARKIQCLNELIAFCKKMPNLITERQRALAEHHRARIENNENL